MTKIYYPVNVAKIVMILFNLAILVAGLAVHDALWLSGVFFCDLIGVQSHFTVFEDTRDTNWVNRLDIWLSLLTLLFLLCKFFVVTAVPA